MFVLCRSAPLTLDMLLSPHTFNTSCLSSPGACCFFSQAQFLGKAVCGVSARISVELSPSWRVAEDRPHDGDVCQAIQQLQPWHVQGLGHGVSSRKGDKKGQSSSPSGLSAEQTEQLGKDKCWPALHTHTHYNYSDGVMTKKVERLAGRE